MNLQKTSEGSCLPLAFPQKTVFASRDELEGRIGRFQQKLRQGEIDGALILQNADLYYFTGSVQTGYLWIPAEGDPVYWAKKSYERARTESALPLVEPIDSVKELPARVAEALGRTPAAVGMELDVLPANNYFFYQKLWAESRIVDCTPTIRTVRAVKSPWEIERLRQAGAQIDAVMKKVPGIVTENLREIDVAAQVEAWLRQEGHQGLIRMRAFNQEIFYGHIFAGPSAAVPSYFDAATGGPGLSPSHPVGAGLRPIGRGEPIIIDYVGVIDGYCVDQTRVLSIGPLDKFFEQAQENVLAIQQAVIEATKPGVTSGELYGIAWKKAVELGCHQHLQGHGDTQVKFIGHGVGIELDEYPFLANGMKTVMEPGMVFALEPKLVYPGKGIAGIENTWLLTDDGVERLTVTPDEVMSV